MRVTSIVLMFFLIFSCKSASKDNSSASKALKNSDTIDEVYESLLEANEFDLVKNRLIRAKSSSDWKEMREEYGYLMFSVINSYFSFCKVGLGDCEFSDNANPRIRTLYSNSFNELWTYVSDVPASERPLHFSFPPPYRSGYGGSASLPSNSHVVFFKEEFNINIASFTLVELEHFTKEVLLNWNHNDSKVDARLTGFLYEGGPKIDFDRLQAIDAAEKLIDLSTIVYNSDDTTYHRIDLSLLYETLRKRVNASPRTYSLDKKYAGNYHYLDWAILKSLLGLMYPYGHPDVYFDLESIEIVKDDLRNYPYIMPYICNQEQLNQVRSTMESILVRLNGSKKPGFFEDLEAYLNLLGEVAADPNKDLQNFVETLYGKPCATIR